MKIISILLAISLGLAMAFFTINSQSKKTQAPQITLQEQDQNLSTSLTTDQKPPSNLAEPIAFQQAPEELIAEQAQNPEVLPDNIIIEPQQIWQAATITEQLRPKGLPDGIHVEYIKVADPQALSFSEGKKISLLIPQENKSYVGTVIESTSEFNGNVIMSAGDIENGNDYSSFSIAEGTNTTFVTLATGESIYQIEIDQESGIGVVIDDRELDQYRHDEDGILPPPEGV